MDLYIILSRFAPGAFKDSSELRFIAEEVADKIKQECPDVTWKLSFATMGRFDAVDLVESNDPKQVAKAAMIIRATGRAVTETLPATLWKEYLAAI
jgi:uncharacterized protein with GYD domain